MLVLDVPVPVPVLLPVLALLHVLLLVPPLPLPPSHPWLTMSVSRMTQQGSEDVRQRAETDSYLGTDVEMIGDAGT